MKFKLFLLIWVFCLDGFAQNYVPGYKEAGLASHFSDKFLGKKTASGELYKRGMLVAAHRKLPFNTLVRVTNTRNGKYVNVRVIDRGPFSHRRIMDVSLAAAQQLDMVQDGTTDVIIEVIRIGTPDTDPNDSSYLPQWSVAKTPKPKVKEKTTSAPKSKVKEKTTQVPKKVVKKSKPVVTSKIYKPTATYSIWGTKRIPSGFTIQLGSFLEEEWAKNVGKDAMKSGQEIIYIYAYISNETVIYRVLSGNYDSQEEAIKNLNSVQSKGFPKAFVRKHL